METHSRGVEEVAGLYAGSGDFSGVFSTGGARRAALYFLPFKLDSAHNNCSTNQRAEKQKLCYCTDSDTKMPGNNSEPHEHAHTHAATDPVRV